MSWVSSKHAISVPGADMGRPSGASFETENGSTIQSNGWVGSATLEVARPGRSLGVAMVEGGIEKFAPRTEREVDRGLDSVRDFSLLTPGDGANKTTEPGHSLRMSAERSLF